MRKEELIMQGWTLQMGDKSETLDLPHTWNATDGQDGGDDYYRGTCIYKKNVPKPEYNTETEAVFLEFDGVNSSAAVFFNGDKVCVHDGGYSTFRVDVTALIKDNNEILVEVDNSVNNRVYPQKADFTFYGGIYRDVRFLIVNKEHFALECAGGKGIYITTEIGKPAKVKVCSALEISDKKDMYVLYDIFNMAGKKLATKKVDAYSFVKNPDTVVGTYKLVCDDKVNDSKDIFAETDFEIDEPVLWEGKKNPYLYKAVAKLCKDDVILDEVSTDFGIRSIKVDKELGFLLNDHPYPLRGVSRHQDRKALGNAITYKMMDEDMELIKEVGANCIRLAHYQHNQYFYDLCDREGMVVWSEIPYISAYLSGGDENTYNQMVELITQNYNHPSIVTWGISNEITIDNKASRGANLINHEKLNDLIHTMDPSRPTSIACYAMCTPFHPVTKIPDIVGWNLYLGWYVPGLFLNDVFMWFYHTFYKKPLGYSEYGAEGMPNLHSEKPKRGDHSEEYQAIYHEYMIKCFIRHPYLWSTFVWNMFDFAADARNQGGEPGMNHKGLVTFDRKIKKDSFYLYKAWWSEVPFVHLASKRFLYRNRKNICVKAYSNQKMVSLYVDGVLFKEISGDRVFEFKKVPLNSEGETHIEVRAFGVSDSAVFIYTADMHKEYVLNKEKESNAQNWV